MRSVGQVVGVAVSASFLLSGLSAVVGNASPGTLELNTLSADSHPALVGGFIAGMHRAYLASTGFAALGVAASLIREERPAPPAEVRRRRAA